MKPITDENIHLFRAHRRAMEQRLTGWIAGKLIAGYTLKETFGKDRYTVTVDMSFVDGRCHAVGELGSSLSFDDPWQAARHYANRRMQGWTTLTAY